MSSHAESSLPTVTEHYGHDHTRLDDLLKQFEVLNEADPVAAHPIFADFKAGLERHIGWEEEILFPIFEARTGMRDGGPTAVMRWEHTMIKDFLLKIHDSLARQKKAIKEDVRGLHGLLKMHNHKEENILYPALDSMIGSAERVRLFADMEKYSDGHSHPVCA
jgi:iron-sulfur cluster repair protein YtfE (RIC family)